MAILRIWRGKGVLSDAVSYVENPEKTSALAEALEYAADAGKTSGEQMRYVSAINCLPETAVEEMEHVKRQFGKEGGRQYYHAKQSFHPEEKVTAEEVHQIGIELAKRLWSDYQVVITTHIDQAHLHNHFIINSVSFSDGKKFSNRKEDIYAARMENDRLCRAHGLTTLKDKRYRGKSYRDWKAGKEGYKTLRDYIKEDVDVAIAASLNMEDFLSCLMQMGYTIKEGKHLSVHPAGYVNGMGNDGYIRLRSLNDPRYTKEGIEARLRDNYRRTMGVQPYYGRRKRSVTFAVKKRQKLPYYKALYYKYMYQMGKLKRRPKFSPATVRADAIRLRELEKQIKLINRLGITDKRDLDRIYEEKTARFTELNSIRETKRRNPEKNEAAYESLQKEMIEIRGEIKLLEKIQVKTEQMQVTYGQLRSAQKEGEQHVFRSTSSGHGNIHSRTNDNTGGPDNRHGNRDLS